VNQTHNDNNFTDPGPCPECGHSGNPPENRFCGRCGASLERLPTRGRELALKEAGRVTLRERFLSKRLGPVGKTVAVGLTAMAADVGLAWLRRRLERTGRSMLPHAVDRIRREEVPEGGPEYLYSYLLKEAAVLIREGRETRGWFSSELTIRSSRAEKK
jgi:hypothetical protein